MEQILGVSLVIVGVMILISSVDDLAIDIAVLIKRLRSRLQGVGEDSSRACTSPGESQRIAVLIANWHEADILERMVEGNLAAIDYRPLNIVLGVYPNDLETKEAALKVAAKYPSLVDVIVNPQDGPTSKGQMLNVMFSKLFADSSNAPDLAVIHDSEDVIDPASFECYAQHAKDYDFIQIPVFSLDSRHRSWVSAHYMEEFAERHSREMVVRDGLGVMIPSAGVGTCLTRRVVCHMLWSHHRVLASDCLTEDYVLGAEVHRLGFSSVFATPTVNGTRVATREYFPKDFWASVRQKTRWTYGIAFEATRLLGWRGSLLDRYFLYRDRKGAIANLLPPISIVLVALGLMHDTDAQSIYAVMLGTGILNTTAMALRLWVKVVAVREVYGVGDFVGILKRWPIAVSVNFLAALFAWQRFFGSAFATRPVAWDKTKHELPESFAAPGFAVAGEARSAHLGTRIEA